MSALKNGNLALAFLLELCALAALAYWGFNTGSDTLIHIILGIGAPLIAAIVWGTFLAPRAAKRIPPLASLVLKILVFGAAALGLAAVGQTTLAVVFAVLVVINLFFAQVWKQEPGLSASA